jgi:isopenicillin-N epimerase
VWFMENLALPMRGNSIKRLAVGMVNCDPKDVVLVPNATSGVQAATQSMLRRGLGADDVVLCLDVCYGACYNGLLQLCRVTGARMVAIPTANSVGDDDAKIADRYSADVIAGRVEAALARWGSHVKYCVFEHISSFPAVVMPIARMVQAARRHGALVCVDGAHAIGNVHIDLRALDPDFYVSNLHKWLCAAKSVAFMYVRRGLQVEVEGTCVSHGHGQGLQAEFAWQATADYTQSMTAGLAVQVFRALGMERVRRYTHSLAREAAAALVQKWGTRLVVPERMSECAMATIWLPDCLNDPSLALSASLLHRHLQIVHKIEVPCASLDGGRLALRISAAIYNVKADYERLGDVIAALARLATQDRARLRAQLNQ